MLVPCMANRAWYPCLDSNQKPSGYKPDALTVVLQGLVAPDDDSRSTRPQCTVEKHMPSTAQEHGSLLESRTQRNCVISAVPTTGWAVGYGGAGGSRTLNGAMPTVLQTVVLPRELLPLGGQEGIRTPYLRIAKPAFFLVNYKPMLGERLPVC